MSDGGVPLGWELALRPARHSEEEDDAFLLSGPIATCQTSHGAAVPARDTFSPAKHARSKGQGGFSRSLGEQGSAEAAQPSSAAELSRLARARQTLWDFSIFSGRDGMQLETAGKQESPMLQTLQEFFGHAKGEQNAPKLLARAAASPRQAHTFGDHRGERRCPDGGDEGEASCHQTITRATGTETSAELRQLERSHADICILYKRKG